MVISVGAGYDAFKVKLVDWWSLTSLSSSLLNIILGFYRSNFLTPEILLQKFPRYIFPCELPETLVFCMHFLIPNWSVRMIIRVYGEHKDL